MGIKRDREAAESADIQGFHAFKLSVCKTSIPQFKSGWRLQKNALKLLTFNGFRVFVFHLMGKPFMTLMGWFCLT